MDESQKNANDILIYINNINTDIQYLYNLKNIMTEASIKGVIIGDILSGLDNQVLDLHSKMQKINNDIHDSLQKLIVVEEQVKKDDSKIVFESTMQDVDKFKVVYDRLIMDKLELENIQQMIHQWNTNNSVFIDDMSVQTLKDTINNSLQTFNDEIKNCAEEARLYTQIILEQLPSTATTFTETTVNHTGVSSTDTSINIST